MESDENYTAKSKRDKFGRLSSGIKPQVTQQDYATSRKKDKVIEIEDMEESMPQLNIRPRMGISASSRIYAA